MLTLLFRHHPVQRLALILSGFCVLLFLVVPILVIIPLSFNSDSYFTYPLAGFSLKWYAAFFESPNWLLALRNSLLVAGVATLLSTLLGGAAALGLSHPRFPFKRLAMAIILAPMILPVIISAVALYFTVTRLGLTDSLPALILAHTTIAAPFVIIAVSAGLEGFDQNLMRAAASLGAPPMVAFRRVMLPLLAPSVATGAIFAFVASFDDLVIALFVAGTEQRTLPRQMWSGVRENLDPTILAVATMLVGLSAVVLLAVGLLRRSQRSHSTGGIK